MKKYKTLKPVSAKQIGQICFNVLLDEGFFEEVEETYYAGQYFRLGNYYYQIVDCGEDNEDRCFLSKIGTRMRWGNIIDIVDSKKITQKEFKKMIDLEFFDEFCPIKLKFVEVE